MCIAEADAKTLHKRQLKALLVSVLGFGVMGAIILFAPLLSHEDKHQHIRTHITAP